MRRRGYSRHALAFSISVKRSRRSIKSSPKKVLPSVLHPSLITSEDSCAFTLPSICPSVHPLDHELTDAEDGESGKMCFCFVFLLPCLLLVRPSCCNTASSTSPTPNPDQPPPRRVPCQGQVQMARPCRRPRVRLRYLCLNLFQESAKKS